MPWQKIHLDLSETSNNAIEELEIVSSDTERWNLLPTDARYQRFSTYLLHLNLDKIGKIKNLLFMKDYI